MSKIAIVGDLHLGASPNNTLKFETILASQRKFFHDCLIPTLKKENISTIVFTGDVYDQRRRVDSKISQYVEELFEYHLSEFKCIIIQGNHDTYYKDDLEVTALSNIWSKSNVTVINKITPALLGQSRVLYVPWLTTSLMEEFNSNLDSYKGKYEYCIGHFETIGFPYEAGTISTDGIDPSVLYNTFKNVLSGHFHTQSYKEVNGNSIHYVGTPFQLTFGDTGEVKGFIVLDTETNERSFVENTGSSKFIKLHNIEDVRKHDTLFNCFVELEYLEGTTPEELYKIEHLISEKNPLTYKSYMKSVNKLSDIMADKTEEETKNFNDMSVAIHSENILSMTKVYSHVKPYDDMDMVLEIIEDLRAKISG